MVKGHSTFVAIYLAGRPPPSPLSTHRCHGSLTAPFIPAPLQVDRRSWPDPWADSLSLVPDLSGSSRCVSVLRPSSIGLTLSPPFASLSNDLLSTPVLTVAAAAGNAVPADRVRATERKVHLRSFLLRLSRVVTPEFLAAWKAKGVTAVVVPLDEVTKSAGGPWQGRSIGRG